MPRCRTFMWFALHNKLLTNAERAQGCSWCGAESESLVHVLRDCSETRKLWMTVVDPLAMRQFFQLEVKSWIKRNIHRSMIEERGWWIMFRAEEPADSLLAELWAVLFGLKMCWDAGERRVCLESGLHQFHSAFGGLHDFLDKDKESRKNGWWMVLGFEAGFQRSIELALIESLLHLQGKK
ncbi:hypothetical protein K1719_036640 [Acacia pycnantha]|nr:hypothetical protein K1719_036640 [Acacia pycnantha]